jgi:hypothetical protein
MATSVDFCPAEVVVPATIRRMETHVRTTSNARKNVRTRFFIQALLGEKLPPAHGEPV